MAQAPPDRLERRADEVVARARATIADARADEIVAALVASAGGPVEPSPTSVRSEIVAGLAVALDGAVGADELADLVGLVHQAAVPAATRKQRGVHYTRRATAEAIVDAALAALGARVPERIVDPACGGGQFLLAAGRALHRRGLTPAEAVGRLAGVDIDPGAAAAARVALRAWSGVDEADVTVGDGVDALAGRTAEVVVGNPPFQSQLRRRTARGLGGHQRRRTALEGLVGAYTDEALVFLAAAVAAAPEGGVVALVLPESAMGSRDGEAIRAEVDRVAPMRAVWFGRGDEFGAGVRTWAPVVGRGPADTDRITVVPPDGAAAGGTTLPRPHGGRWSALLAERAGVPRADVVSAGVLGDVAEATAGFRDEYYALAGAVVEDSRGRRPVVTTGLIDPGCSLWGRRPARIAKRSWRRPGLDPDRVDAPRVRAWLEQLSGPKVLVAPQGRVIEAWVDRDGRAVPLTPVVAVWAVPSDLDRVAAVVLSPVATVLSWWRRAGTGLGEGTIRYRARDLLDLPLPADAARWDAAAALVPQLDERGADPVEVLDRLAREMLAAYGLAPGAAEEVHTWWRARLPGGH